MPSGGYFGPKKMPQPACTLSDKGKAYMESFNKHLAELHADTVAAAKSNATIAAKLAKVK